MSAFVSSIEIDRAPADVFAYVTDPARFSEWQDDVVSVRMDMAGSWKGEDFAGPALYACLAACRAWLAPCGRACERRSASIRAGPCLIFACTTG